MWPFLVLKFRMVTGNNLTIVLIGAILGREGVFLVPWHFRLFCMLAGHNQTEVKILEYLPHWGGGGSGLHFFVRFITDCAEVLHGDWYQSSRSFVSSIEIFAVVFSCATLPTKEVAVDPVWVQSIIAAWNDMFWYFGHYVVGTWVVNNISYISR